MNILDKYIAFDFPDDVHERIRGYVGRQHNGGWRLRLNLEKYRFLEKYMTAAPVCCYMRHLHPIVEPTIVIMKRELSNLHAYTGRGTQDFEQNDYASFSIRRNLIGPNIHFVDCLLEICRLKPVVEKQTDAGVPMRSKNADYYWEQTISSYTIYESVYDDQRSPNHNDMYIFPYEIDSMFSIFDV